MVLTCLGEMQLAGDKNRSEIISIGVSALEKVTGEVPGVGGSG